MLNNLLREKDKEELIQIIRQLEEELEESIQETFIASNVQADLILDEARITLDLDTKEYRIKE